MGIEFGSKAEKGEEKEGEESTGARDILLQLHDIAMHAPHGKSSETARTPLVAGLSLALREGESLLISGGSGLGKSSLLRAIAGLWSQGQGVVERCPVSECFFVPQQPYMCLGTLREQATYPGGSDADDEEILAALKEVNIGYLVERHGMDTVVDFSTVLSLGEQQRLGFARLSLRRGIRLALVDEGTSALDEENEASLYKFLRSKLSCFISVGHRPQLHRFHTHRLSLRALQHGGCTGTVEETSAGQAETTIASSCQHALPLPMSAHVQSTKSQL